MSWVLVLLTYRDFRNPKMSPWYTSLRHEEADAIHLTFFTHMCSLHFLHSWQTQLHLTTHHWSMSNEQWTRAPGMSLSLAFLTWHGQKYIECIGDYILIHFARFHNIRRLAHMVYWTGLVSNPSPCGSTQRWQCNSPSGVRDHHGKDQSGYAPRST